MGSISWTVALNPVCSSWVTVRGTCEHKRVVWVVRWGWDFESCIVHSPQVRMHKPSSEVYCSQVDVQRKLVKLVQLVHWTFFQGQGPVVNANVTGLTVIIKGCMQSQPLQKKKKKWTRIDAILLLFTSQGVSYKPCTDSSTDLNP